MVTLHGHIGAERGDRGGVTRQSFETGLQDAPIFCSYSGAALMRHPDFHAGKVPQQGSEFCKDPIAGRTQPRITGRQIHTLVLGQGLTWMLKDVLLLNVCRTLDP